MSPQRLILLWLLSLLCALPAYAQTAATAATVTTTIGTVVAQRADGVVRTLAQGSTLGVGTIVSTQANSSARVKFGDGSVTTLSANSRVRLDAYRFVPETPQSNNLIMSLLKGGLRSVTGLIGRQGNGKAHTLKTSQGRLNATAADYIARACDADCAKEVKLTGTGKILSSAIPARVAVLVGQAVATSKLGVSRALKVGAPVYVGEIIETRADAHAVLAFIDEGKITLQPLTRLIVQQFRYEPGKEQQGRALIYYLKGGMRVLTGLLGNKAPKKYKVRTAIGYIGIRGTGFDTWCGGTCESERNPLTEPKRQPPAGNDERNGLYVNTWQGEVEVGNAAGVRVVSVGQTAHVDSADSEPEYVPAMPSFFRNLPGPRPDRVNVNLQQLFGLGEEYRAAGGLHVTVKEGAVVLDRERLQVEFRNGETGYLSETAAEVAVRDGAVVLSRESIPVEIVAGETVYIDETTAEFFALRYPQVFLENDEFLTTQVAAGAICGFGY